MSYAEEIRKTISDGLSGIYAGVPFPLKKVNLSKKRSCSPYLTIGWPQERHIR